MSLDEAVREIDEAIAAGQPSWPQGSADLYAHIARGIRKKREARRAEQAQQQREGE